RVRRRRPVGTIRLRHTVRRDRGDVDRQADQRALAQPQGLPGRRGQRPRSLQRRSQWLSAAAPPLDRGGGRGAPSGVASAVAGRRGAMSREGWRGLGALVRLASARPVVTILLSVVLAFAALTHTFRHLGFVTSGRDLLPQDRPYVQRDEEISDDFPRLDQLVVAIESDDVERSKAYAHRLAEELRREPGMFRHVTYRIDPKRFRGRELLYLSPPDLRDVRDEVADHQAFLTSFAARPTLDRLIDGIRTEIVTAFVRSAFDLGLDGDEKKVDLGAAREVVDEISTRLDR